MRKIIFISSLMTIFIFNTALANISVSPFYIELDANSKKRSDQVRLTNTGKEEKTYRMKLINYKQNEDGSYEAIEEPLENSPFASQFIEFSPHETTLGPGQSQTIRLQRKAMPTAKDGEYVSHFLMQEQPGKISPNKDNKDGINVDIKTVYGVTIPVIITKGELESSGTIKDVKILEDEKHPLAEVTISRTGNKSFHGTIIVKEDDEEIGRINAFRIFLSSAQRIIKVPLTKIPKNKYSIVLINEKNNEVVSKKDI